MKLRAATGAPILLNQNDYALLKMLDAHAWGLAAGYAAASVAAGFAAIQLASAMVRRVRVRVRVRVR